MLTHKTLDDRQLQEYSPILLAYIGDAVFELLVRNTVMNRGKRKIRDIHQDVVEVVKAKNQAQLTKNILPILTEEEKDIVRRGRNSKSTAPRNTDPGDYHLSTGFETLLGYLYLQGNEKRLQELYTLVVPE